MPQKIVRVERQQAQVDASLAGTPSAYIASSESTAYEAPQHAAAAAVEVDATAGGVVTASSGGAASVGMAPYTWLSRTEEAPPADTPSAPRSTMATFPDAGSMVSSPLSAPATAHGPPPPGQAAASQHRGARSSSAELPSRSSYRLVGSSLVRGAITARTSADGGLARGAVTLAIAQSRSRPGVRRRR
ncbi:hypothetical protein PVAP13_6NG217500 [Panicum virgatum]|uniref:Uncharacterized protein n=1 Tax=Panicum virgatum TaxID=38727 RepID=A0A8T0QXK5_PANVG|nr:hypothetical protein PVAP13_6NG217500 [Panicum virgatum]